MQAIPIPIVIAGVLGVITLFNLPGCGPVHAEVVPSAPESSGKILYGMVMAVHDGDSFSIAYSGMDYEAKNGLLPIRLHGGDSPEYDDRRPYFQQPFGKEARHALAAMIRGRQVELIVRGVSYRRPVADVYCNGLYVNAEMVRLGLAWVDSRFVSKKELPKFLALQDEARSARRGVWSQSDPVAPWTFREQIKREQHERNHHG